MDTSIAELNYREIIWDSTPNNVLSIDAKTDPNISLIAPSNTSASVFIQVENLQDCILNYRFEALSCTTIDIIIFAQNVYNTTCNIKLILSGEQSKVDLRSAFTGNASDIFKFNTIQQHNASHSTSNVLFKSALNDKSRSHFNGMIYIPENLHECKAFQQNRNLLLSDSVIATGKPNLNIRSQDVKCSHGVSFSGIDKIIFFYMISRGISERNALKLLSKGFVLSIFENFYNTKLSAKISGINCKI